MACTTKLKSRNKGNIQRRRSKLRPSFFIAVKNKALYFLLEIMERILQD